MLSSSSVIWEKGQLARCNEGFTLIELMISVAVLFILSTVAINGYESFIGTSREAALLQTIQSVKLFEEDRRLREGRYISGVYDPANPEAEGGLSKNLGWEPNDQSAGLRVSVVCGSIGSSPECAHNSSLQISARHSEGQLLCRNYDRGVISDC